MEIFATLLSGNTLSANVYDITIITMTKSEHYESTLSFPVFANYLQN